LEFGLVVFPMHDSHVVHNCSAKIAVIVLILSVTNLAVIIHRSHPDHNTFIYTSYMSEIM